MEKIKINIKICSKQKNLQEMFDLQKEQIYNPDRKSLSHVLSLEKITQQSIQNNPKKILQPAAVKKITINKIPININKETLIISTNKAIKEKLDGFTTIYSIYSDNNRLTKSIKIGILPFNIETGKREPLYHPKLKEFLRKFIMHLNQQLQKNNNHDNNDNNKNNENNEKAYKFFTEPMKQTAGCYSFEEKNNRKKILKNAIDNNENQTDKIYTFLKLSWHPKQYIKERNTHKTTTQSTESSLEKLKNFINEITLGLEPLEKQYIIAKIQQITKKEPHAAYGLSLKKEIEQIKQKKYSKQIKEWMSVHKSENLLEALSNYLTLIKKRKYDPETAKNYLVQSIYHQKFIHKIKKELNDIKITEKQLIDYSILAFLRLELKGLLSSKFEEKCFGKRITKIPQQNYHQSYSTPKTKEKNIAQNYKNNLYITSPVETKEFIKNLLDKLNQGNIEYINKKYHEIPEQIIEQINLNILPSIDKEPKAIKIPMEKNENLETLANQIHKNQQEILLTIALYDLIQEKEKKAKQASSNQETIS